MAQLTEYEPIYKARQILEQGGSSSGSHRQKRKCEQLSEMVDIDLIQPPSSPATDSDDNNMNVMPTDLYFNDINYLSTVRSA